MGNNILSQEEIDALLNMDAEAASIDETDTVPELSEEEKDTLGEIGNISMGTAATTLSLLLDRRVQITIPRVAVTTPREICLANPMPFAIVEVGYTEGLTGRNLLVMQTKDAAIIADLMMGRDGLDPQTEIDDLVLSALAEAMNQMMGSAATSMSSLFNRTIIISPPTAKVIDLQHEPLDADLASDEYVIKIAFSMIVENLIDSEIMLVLRLDFAQEMLRLLEEQTANIAAQQESPQTVAEPVAAAEQEAAAGVSAAPELQAQIARERTMSPAPEPAVTVQPVEFQPLSSSPSAAALSDTGNLHLLLDVPLQLTVELGRTEKTIKEVLELVPGSIFELDRVAGEPVDVYVNGKLVAQGEVVVIDENFGVRITDIASVIDRVSNLQ